MTREEYDGYTRAGTSTYVHSIKVGLRRWYIEFYVSGVYLRLGSIDFTAGFDWVDADA